MEEKIIEIEKTQIEMVGNISHIKSRIDNGLGKTITACFEMLNKLVGELNETKSRVHDHEFWINMTKKAFVFLAITGCIGGAVGLAITLIKKGI